MDTNNYEIVLTEIAKEELEEIEEEYKQVVIYRIIYGKMDYLKIIED